MSLESLGADEAVQSAFQPYIAQGLVLARVVESQRAHFRLVTADGEIQAEASGALWYRTPDRAGMAVTGDWVAARLTDSLRTSIEAVLPRKTLFS